LDCKNCGAPMIVLRGDGYLFCEYCSTFHFPTESRDRVRVLGESSGFHCPVCKVRLVLARISDAEVLHCPRCRGILMMQLFFSHVVKDLRAQASGPPRRSKPLNPDDLKRSIHCPHCDRSMVTHPYYGPGSVVIDRCSHCDLIWLDRGELSTIIDAPGRDRPW
jgi:Zn-finger nucleic acid-binding protein